LTAATAADDNDGLYLNDDTWRAGDRRQRRRGRIAGNIWSAGDEISLYPAKFVMIVIKLHAELMYTVQPAFAVQARHPDIQRESDSPYFA